MRKWKQIVSVLLIILVVFLVVVFFLMNSRVTIESTLNMPSNRLPIYIGNSTPLIKANFTYSNENYENCQEGLCFFVENGEIQNFSKKYKGLIYSGEFVNVTDDTSIIIDRIKEREFSCLGPYDDLQYPMSGLGTVKIINYEIGYYNEISYSYKEGEGVYVPVYVLYAETSNYGEVRIIVWATSELRYEQFP